MQLRFTAVGCAGVPVDVAVDGPPRTPFAAVAPGLAELVGSGAPWAHGEAIASETPIGEPPLLQGAVLTLGVPPEQPAAGRVLELRVVAGPDSGTIHPLGPGETTIGRAMGAAITVEDGDLSRLHAVLSVRADGVSVRDLGSTNGTSVRSPGNATARGALTPVGPEPVPLPVGGWLHVGASTLELAIPDVALAAVIHDGEGHVHVNRPPRLLPPATGLEVTLPRRPVLRERPRFPLLMTALPLVLGAVLLAVYRNPMYLLFLLLSPLMLIANYLSDRASGRRGNSELEREYAEKRAAALRRAESAAVREEHARRQAAPDAAELLATVTGPRPRLWERRPDNEDFLAVRIGVGEFPSAVLVRDASEEDSVESRSHPPLSDVPLTVSLREAGVTGVAGPRAPVLRLARSVVAQVAGWHSHRDVQLVLLGDETTAPDWHWARHLAHLLPLRGQQCRSLVGWAPRQVHSRVAELTALLDERQAAQRTASRRSSPGPITLVVLDGARRLRAAPGVARLLEEGPGCGISVLCVDSDPESLPAECRATVLLSDSHPGASVRTATSAPVDLHVTDGVSPQLASRFGRALAPLRDATPDGDGASIPTSARLLDVLGVDATDSAAIARGWRRRPRSTEAIIGAASGGRFAIDLSRDGPHALVAGTTGAGKSELLQTLVASLAVVNRTDEMSFVLVDYKGGSAFRECAKLPHTVGMVTDLDPQLTERALTSLSAELRRRERLLHDAGCKDIDDYLAGPAVSATGPRSLARLVLVIDEFATLVEELPDFVDGLVGIAQRGRSLGIHLVLATQRPSGAVRADIRANTSLRIALRVADPAESLDVIDVRDAASIPRDVPGRGYARVGTATVMPLQTARVAGCDDRAEAAVSVRPVSWLDAGDAPQSETRAVDERGVTDLERLVTAVTEAAASVSAAAAPSPWLPPLPALLTRAQLPPPGSAAQIPIGLVDMPAEQRQAPYAVDLAGGRHVAVVGGARSGRTSVLRSLTAGVVERLTVADAHVFAIDSGSGALVGLASAPHCGAVVSRDETGRGMRLLSRLAGEVARRQRLLREARVSSVA